MSLTRAIIYLVDLQTGRILDQFNGYNEEIFLDGYTRLNSYLVPDVAIEIFNKSGPKCCLMAGLVYK